MAFADTGLRVVLEAGMIQRVTMAAACDVGDLLGISGVTYVLAQDTHAIEVAAVALALEKAAAGATCAIARFGRVSGFTGGSIGNSLFMIDGGGYADALGALHRGQAVGITVGAYDGIVDLRPGVAAALTTAALSAGASVQTNQIAAHGRVKTRRSRDFDLDNGAATTIDDCVMVPHRAVTVIAARLVYTVVTSGVCAAGNVKVGTSVAGAQIVAATAYENAKTVGTKTALTIVSGAVPANTPIIVRHTGVAAAVDGYVFVEIDYTVDD